MQVPAGPARRRRSFVRSLPGSIYIKSVYVAPESDPADPGHSINIGPRDRPAGEGPRRVRQRSVVGRPAQTGPAVTVMCRRRGICRRRVNYDNCRR